MNLSHNPPRAVPANAIFSHLAKAIEQGEIALNGVIPLSLREIEHIHDALLKLDDDAAAVKKAHKQLEGAHDPGMPR